MQLNTNGLKYMKACDAQCLLYVLGEALALFANRFNCNNEFQGRARKREEFGRNRKADLKQSSSTRADKIGEKSQIMLECSTKCKSMTNVFCGRKGRSGRLFEI